MAKNPAWWFDEFRHFGVDFDDSEQVATYDSRQQTSLDNERKLAQQLGITSGMRVIEFGPGTGALSRACALEGADVISVDISQAMLDYGLQAAESLGVQDQMTFIRSGFLSYEHQGDPVDFIVTQFAFHHLPDFWKAIALRQMNKLLKIGGKLYLRDAIYSFEVDDAYDAIEEWFHKTASDSGDGFSRAEFEAHVRDEFSTFNWIIEGLLQRAGFTIESADYTAPTYAHYICSKTR